MSQLHLYALILVAATGWAVVLAWNGTTLSTDFAKPFSMAVACASSAIVVFDRFVWRWRWLRPWFVGQPDLNGTWKVTIHPVWSPQDELQSDIEAYAVVRQTYSRLSMRLLTSESESELVACTITSHDDGVSTLVGVYRNTPRIGLREQSPIHYGSLILRVEGDVGIKSLDGWYWTDRRSGGDLKFVFKGKSHAFDYTSAAK